MKIQQIDRRFYQENKFTAAVPKKNNSALYRISATKITDTARIASLATVAFLAISYIPVVTADPCAATERACVATCIAMGGPDPRESGACLIGCKLAYIACKATASYFGFNW